MRSQPTSPHLGATPEEIGHQIATLWRQAARLDGEAVLNYDPDREPSAKIKDRIDQLCLHALRLRGESSADVAHQAAIGADRIEVLVDVFEPGSYPREVARAIQKVLFQCALDRALDLGLDQRDFANPDFPARCEHLMRLSDGYTEDHDLTFDEPIPSDESPFGNTAHGDLATAIVTASVECDIDRLHENLRLVLGNKPETQGDCAIIADVIAQTLFDILLSLPTKADIPAEARAAISLCRNAAAAVAAFMARGVAIPLPLGRPLTSEIPASASISRQPPAH